MKHFLFSFSRLLVVFLASFTVFFALVVLVMHLVTPHVSRKIRTIERFAENALHMPVQMSQFSVTWRGLRPVLNGREVIIWDNTHTWRLFQIEQLELSIDLFKSLLTGNMSFAEIRGRGIELHIRQVGNKQFTLNEGMKVSLEQGIQMPEQGARMVLFWLFGEPVVRLNDISLSFDPMGGLTWPEMRLNLLLKNQQDRHRLSTRLLCLGKRTEYLRLITDIVTTSSSPSLDTLEVHSYLEGRAIWLDKWLSLFVKKYSLQGGLVHFKLWADWFHGRFTAAHVLLDHMEPSVFHMDKQPPLSITPFFAHVDLDWPVQAHWSIAATVRDLGFSAWNKIPGVRGLDADCYVTPKSGRFSTHSSNVTLDFERLFKEQLHLNKLTSELTWERGQKGIAIHVSKLDAQNVDMSVNAQLAVLLPEDKTKAVISMLARVKTDRPSRIAYYLPLPWMEKELIHWLDSAIIRGSGDGVVLLRGPLSSFPFDQDDGVFSVDSQVKNVELHYEPSWPNLKKIDGNLVFYGRQMHVLVDHAQIFGVPLQKIRASIPVIKGDVQAVLHIMASELNTRLEKGLSFLKRTPLAQKTGGRLSGLLMNGPLHLALELSIPLESGPEALRVSGLGTTESAIVEIPSHDLQIDDLKGQFSLSQNGVEAQNLKGLLWDQPITIGIHATPSTWLNIDYDGMQTTLVIEKEGWRFHVHNQFAEGSVLVPNNIQQAMGADFDWIVLGPSLFSQNKEWRVTRIPKINLRARDVRYQEMDFGGVQVNLRPTATGIAIENFQAGNTEYHVIMNGAWHRGASSFTELMGQLDTSHLSNFLRNLGVLANISAEQAHVRFNVQWLGMPHEITTGKLYGNFSFRASNGKIVDIGSSAAAKLSFGRLLTFLSLQSLGRRLQLDFSDLKEKGFDFTELRGHFLLRRGNALTRDIFIDGPVAAIAISGRIGLLTKDYDLVIKVRPHFTSSLPVIVGLAGGPIAGVVTWIANAVLGSTVQKIAETSYHLTGSWGSPRVRKAA